MGYSGEPLQRKLSATRHWWRLTRVLSGLTWVLSIVVLLALICYHSDRIIVLSIQAREMWRTGIALTAGLTLLLALLQPLLRRLSDVSLATDVERRFPILRERLLTTLDLAPAMAGGVQPESARTDKPSASHFSEQMTNALSQETCQVSSGLNFKRAVSLRPLRNGILTLAFTLILLLLHIVFAREAFATWLRRMSDPRADIPPYAKTRVQIVPDATLLARGDGTSVTVKTWGDPVDHCVLRVHQEGDSDKTWTNLELTRPTPVANAKPDEKDARTFRYHFQTLPHSIALVASANDGRSNERAVLVEDRPTLLNVRLALHFPAYMHRKDQTIPETTGAIAAPFGTQVDVVGVANKPLKSAQFVRDNTVVGNWLVSGTQTNGHIGVSKDGTYRLKLVDTHNFSNLDPARYEIRSIKDEAPSVQILRPATDIDLVPGGSIPLIAHATDDYGVSTAKLIYNATHEDSLRTGRDSITQVGGGAFTLPAEYGPTQVDIRQRWFIGSVHPKVGDVIRYEVDGYDNDNLSGPHIGRSMAYRIHVVSVVEKQTKLKELLDAEQQALALARQHQLEAQKQVEQVEQARTKADPAKMARAQEAQRSVAQETKAVAQRIQDLSNELENNNFATKSELARRQQAQQTLIKSVQQKMNPAADKVQQAQNAKPNSSERNQDLQQADQQQTQAKQDIEHAQDLLQRTPTADQLAKAAQQLAQEQTRLAESARSLAEDIKQQQQQNKTDTLAPEQKTALQMEQRQQAQVNADTRKLEKGLKKAAQEAQERGDTKQAEELKRASEALKQGDAKGNQTQAQQNLGQNKPQQAAPAQDKAATALQKAAESAAKAADQNPSSDPKTSAEKAEAAAQQLHELAKQQAEVAKQVGQNPSSQQSKDLAQKEQQIQQQAQQAQQNLDGAKSAQQSAQKAQQNLSQSEQKLSQNQPQGAKQPAQDAAKQLEDAAKQAERAAEQLRQQQQAQELADKVERLAQIQHGLESATQRLEQNKATLTPNDIRERRKVAAQQQSLEKQANDVAQKIPSKAFQQAVKMAAGQMHPANENLNGKDGKGEDEPNTGADTQKAQHRAAQTLDAVTQALKQQAQANQQQQQQAQANQPPGQQGQPTPQEQQAAEAAAEVALAQALQKQLRQDTGTLDKQRAKNPNNALTPEQQKENAQLAEGQHNAQEITENAAQSLENAAPDAAQSARQAGEHMDQAKGKLQQQQTGQPTQGQQDQALQKLDSAAKQAQQAMQQQQQQQQQQQAAAQGAPKPGSQPGQQKGNKPGQNPFARLEGVQRGALSSPGNRNGKGFSQLSGRDQRSLREGGSEHVPAEYQDLVNRYYKSLAEQKR